MKLYNSDCLKILEKLEDNSVDMVLVDLPYGQTHHKWDREIDLTKMWKELKRCCIKKCTYAFFCTTAFGYKLIQSNPSWFAYDIVWEKINSVGFLSAKKIPLRKHEMIYIFKDPRSNDTERKLHKELRSYSKDILDYLNGIKINDINKKMGNKEMSHFLGYKNQRYKIPNEENYIRFTKLYELDKMEGFKTYEEIKTKWVNEKQQFVYNPQMTEGEPYKRRRDKIERNTPYGNIYRPETDNHGTRYPVSILKFGYDKEKLHPTQKPVKLCEWLVKTYTNEGGNVLDFTMGSGSTGIACINTNRNFIGIEMDTEIFKVAKERLNI